MEQLRNKQTENFRDIVQGKWPLILLAFFWLGGCNIWNGYLDPDYESSRAERLCHPYGECSQGNWVAVDGSAKDPAVAKVQCHEAVDLRYGNGWWADPVARGLEIGTCMEKKGYRLQQ